MAALAILCATCVGCQPHDVASTEAGGKGTTTMATGNLKLQEAIQRCQRGTAADVDKVFSDLRDATFLAALDGSQPYRLRQTPPGLSELLQNVAAITTAPDIPERLIALGNTREYAAADPDGSLRRTALIEAMGCVARPSDTIVSYLDAELDVAEGRYRSTAVSSLARLGTPKAFEVLRVRIYQRNTSIISEQTRAASNHPASAGAFLET